MEKLFFEDYAVNEQFESPARTITETDIVIFASLTGDWHPIHTNVEYAKENFPGERIAHGMLTLCVGSALIFRLGLYVYLPKSFIAFYGMDSIRFLGPVKIGDTIRCVVQVEKLEVKDEKTGLIVYRNSIKNQKDEDVVAYTTRFLVGRNIF
jgi:acyl dehydratase